MFLSALGAPLTLIGFLVAIVALIITPSPGATRAEGATIGLIVAAVGFGLGLFAARRKSLGHGGSALSTSRLASHPFPSPSGPSTGMSAETGAAPAELGGLSASPPAIRTTTARGRRQGRQRAADPRLQTLIVAMLLSGAIVAAILTFSSAERSSYTQDHGVRTAAHVGYVDNDTSCGRESCTKTFSAPVTLDTRVDGQTQSTIHGRGVFNAYEQTIEVLVDPEQPGYAELPGRRLQSWGAFIDFTILSVLLGALSVAAVWRLLRHYPGLLPQRST
jgi:hypothetical protein